MYKKTDWRGGGSGDWCGLLSPARIKFTRLGVQELEVTGKKNKTKQKKQLYRCVTPSPAVLSQQWWKGIPHVARSVVNSLYRGKKRGSKQTSLAHPNSTTDASSGKYRKESSEPCSLNLHL